MEQAISSSLTEEQILQVAEFKVFGFTLEFGVNRNSQPTAKAFHLKAKGCYKGMPKNLFFYRFATEERRAEFLNKELASMRKRAEAKTAKANELKAAKSSFVNPYKTGQIFYDSWGYDQTNIDFYQVVEVKEKSVVLRPIAGKIADKQPGGGSDMSCYVVPEPNNFIGDPVLKVIQLRVWDGKETHFLKSKHGWISEYKGGESGEYMSWYA